MESEVRRKIEEIVGKDGQITKVELEGPEVGIYTRNPVYFLQDDTLVSKIANVLKRRVTIRSDQSILTPPEHAREVIFAVVPEEAGVTNIEFVPELGCAIIEARKPGLVIGKGGGNIFQIVSQTGWFVNVLRAPASDSNIIKGIRNLMVKHVKERKKILSNVGLKINRSAEDTKWVRIHFLGGAREVGRSCFLLETSESKVLLDAGINVASKDNAFPDIGSTKVPLEEIDAVVVTHAHLDHSGFVPYLYKMGYTGPVYCTPPTRDLMSLLHFDYIDVLVKEKKDPPYSERDVKKMVLHTITRNYGEVTDISPDVRITFYNAGHILGSSIVHIHVGKGLHNIVYTGDFKFGFSRLHNPADVKYPRAETVIMESTYGGKEDVHPPRKETEKMLEKVILETMEKNGTVLIPVFAVGRAQEILVTLENIYSRKEYSWPIFIDGMVREASAIYTAYPEYLHRELQRRILRDDSPFEMEFLHVVDSYNKRDELAEEGGCIIMAPSGSLTGGPAVDYFYKLAENDKNTLILVGYQFEGSLGRKLQKGIKEVPYKLENGKLKALNVNMRIETLHGFSGHSDRRQLDAYVRNLPNKPQRVFVVHGEASKTVEFAKLVSKKYKTTAYAPFVLDVLRVR